MDKQEKIKEAYGDYYMTESIDENGWTNEATSDFLNKIPCDGKEMHIVYGKPEWWYRPKSLSGIENNNGWIKIESEADLPKEIGHYWVINSAAKKDSIEYDHFDMRINSVKGLWLDFYTHYQPIEKPKPPLY